MNRREAASLLFAPLAQAQPADLNLPDPLVRADGKPVRSTRDWLEHRRPEIIALYKENVYGHGPKSRPKPSFQLLEDKPAARGGLARRKRVRIFLLGDNDGPWADLLLYLPNRARGPVPAFLGMNYLGNQSVTDEPDIPITPAWIRDLGVPSIVNNAATEGSRGAQVRRWPFEAILGKGFAVATLCYAEVEPDNPKGEPSKLRKGLLSRYPDEKQDWGAIGLWAFGLSRALDYLETEPGIDRKRVALTGHSRLGKTALWAGAQDTRFALVISNDSGEGGASLARRKQGERISDSLRSSAFWYTPKYRQYVDKEETLPVDAHFLISLIAPRPVYVSSATLDTGADPEGEFLAAKAAEPVYRLFGKAGLGISAFPPPDRSYGDAIGYHVRTGSHDILAADWEHHLNFAARHFRR